MDPANPPQHGPYAPDPHSPYGRELRHRLQAQEDTGAEGPAGPGGPVAEGGRPQSGNRITRAAASVFAELENAADAATGRPPAPPHARLATEGNDFFERLDRGVREIAASTERATERRGFTLRRRPRPEGEPPR